MSPNIECIPITNSLFSSVTYVIFTEGNKKIWIVDPGDTDPIFKFCDCEEFEIQGILLTHGHFDHIYGVNRVLDRFPDCFVYTNEYGSKMLQSDRLNMSKYHESPYMINFPHKIIIVNDHEKIRLFKSIDAVAIFTPGHNPSCITWIIDFCLFTGDSYIPGLKTVTNLPGGSKKQAEDSIELIKRLAEGCTIYPGHIVDSTRPFVET